MPHITPFDRDAHHIQLRVFVTNQEKEQYALRAILDTGAPASEFSDQSLQYIGLLSTQEPNKEVALQSGLQTQKYGKIVIPHIEICGHPTEELEVFISHFEKSWGVDALIGLDFFRRFRTTIDYKKGEIETEPFKV